MQREKRGSPNRECLNPNGGVGEMAHFIAEGSPTNLVEFVAGGSRTVDLWAGGPNGERLEVMPSDPSLISVSETPASFGPDIRRFTVQALARGSGRLWARLGGGGAIWADTRVVVDQRPLFRYYHGTSGQIADLLLDVDLTPMFLASVAAGLVVRFDWTDYTDFGKGFYVHLEENQAMAYGWAKRRFGDEWAVVEFIATPDELSDGRRHSIFTTKPLVRAIHLDHKSLL